MTKKMEKYKKNFWYLDIWEAIQRIPQSNEYRVRLTFVPNSKEKVVDLYIFKNFGSLKNVVYTDLETYDIVIRYKYMPEGYWFFSGYCREITFPTTIEYTKSKKEAYQKIKKYIKEFFNLK